MKRFALFLLTLLMAVNANAARLTSCVLKSGESTDYINSHFAAHIGYQAGVNAPAWEYFEPTVYSKSKWLLDLYGKNPSVIPGTDYIDYSVPANRQAMVDCIVQWTAHFNANVGVFLDCLNLTAPGYFWNSVDLFRDVKRAFPPMKVCVNFGDVYSWSISDVTSPWYALGQEADVQFPQVAVNLADSRLSSFSRAIYFATQRLNQGKIVILGVYDPGALHPEMAIQVFDCPLRLNPGFYGYYESDPDPKAPLTTQYPKGLPEPLMLPTLGLNSPLSGTTADPLYAPADNWWNLDISQAPVDPNSVAILQTIKTYESTGGRVHPDFGSGYGMPYCVVDNQTPLVPVTLSNTSESDNIPYPIPAAATTNTGYIENGPDHLADGDRHILIYNRDTKQAFELSYASYTSGRWSAGYGAMFKLDSNYRRPEGWTSTDAAGLCVLAGLVKYDELYGPNPIKHATRVSCKQVGIKWASKGYVWPASHQGSTDANGIPLGMRFRLKASFDTSSYPAPLKKLFDSWKRYGLIVADRGGNMYIQGTLDARWDNSVLNPAFHSLHASDFDVITLGWGKPTS